MYWLGVGVRWRRFGCYFNRTQPNGHIVGREGLGLDGHRHFSHIYSQNVATFGQSRPFFSKKGRFQKISSGGYATRGLFSPFFFYTESLVQTAYIN